MSTIPQTPTPTYAPDPRAFAQYRAAAALNAPRSQPQGMTNGQPANLAGIKKVAEDFEAFFAGEYFEQMFSGLDPDAVTGGGEGEAMFRSLMLQEYGKAVARRHSLGIADVVQRQLLQLQEKQQ